VNSSSEVDEDGTRRRTGRPASKDKRSRSVSLLPDVIVFCDTEIATFSGSEGVIVVLVISVVIEDMRCL
jgi:hypothetical protein